MDYLYHYTSIETLALILKNNTLCFNNLLNVDDSEEAETFDMGKFGAEENMHGYKRNVGSKIQ